MDPAENPLLVVHGYGQNAANTQVRALLMMRYAYTLWKTQDAGIVCEAANSDTILTEKALIDLELLRTQLGGLKGSNLLPITVDPYIPIPYVRPESSKVPEYIDRMYLRLRSKFPRAILDFESSYISTGRVTGVVTALQKIIRPQKIELPSEYLYMTLLRFMVANKFKSSDRIDAPKMDRSFMEQVPVPLHKKSGVVLGVRSEVQVGEDKFCYSNTPTKEELLPIELGRSATIIASIYRELVNGREWCPDVFPVMMNKFAEKPEVRSIKDDPEKVRIFFLVSLLKFLFDSATHIPMHHFLRRMYAYLIGHKWPGGGAEELARELNGHDPDWFWFWWDASKLDQSIVTILISIVCMLSLIVYKPGSREYDVLKNIIAHCADITSVKVVTWVGRYCRMVIGTLFSGDVNTGHIDTMVMSMAWDSFIISIKEDIQKQLRAEKNRLVRNKLEKAMFMLCATWEKDVITPIRIGFKDQPKYYSAKLYGDDGVAAAHKFLRTWINWEKFSQHCLKFMNITLKKEASGESTQFFTEVRPDGSCAEDRPNILKRFFIKIKTPEWQGGKVAAVMPFRPIMDYNIRLGRSTTDVTDPAIEFARLIGLLWDSMGTNLVAWDMITDAIAFLKEEFPTIEQDLLEISGYAFSSDPIKIAKYRKFESVVDYTKKVGGDIEVIRVPKQGPVFYRFLPHDVESRFRNRCQRQIHSCENIWHYRAHKEVPEYYYKKVLRSA